jgi:hypothetical protein
MAASLVHGRALKKEEFIATDGSLRYEVMPVDGSDDTISVSSIVEIKTFCESRGLSPSVWPYYDEINEFNVPIEEVHEKCKLLSAFLLTLPPDDIKHLYWLEVLVSYARKGEVFFFCN